GILTLAPAVLALAVLGVGLARYTRAPVIVGLATLGALIPAICLPFFVPALTNGDLLLPSPLFGGVTGENVLFSPAYRIDAFSVFAAYGIVFLITPILLWMGLHGEKSAPALAEEQATTPDATDDASGDASGDASAHTSDASADEVVASSTPSLMH